METLANPRRDCTPDLSAAIPPLTAPEAHPLTAQSTDLSKTIHRSFTASAAGIYPMLWDLFDRLRLAEDTATGIPRKSAGKQRRSATEPKPA